MPPPSYYPSDRFVAALFIVALVIGFVAWSCSTAQAQSGAHGDGHAQQHDDIYRHWSPPNNPSTSCCNDSDCRPTRAWLGDDGRWRAHDGLGWVIIPPGRVLPTDYAKDGRSHLCEKAGFVYCFSPGEARG